MILRPVKTLKIVCVMCVLIYVLLTHFNVIKQNTSQSTSLDVDYKKKVSTLEMKKNFSTEEIKKMSSLGKWLISPEANPPPRITNAKSTFHLILMWKYGPVLENRHIKRFSSKKFSPWENCSVQCQLSYNSTDMERADAVIFHLHRIKNVNELPVRRNYNQRWIFLTDESPMNTFLHASQKLSDYNRLFNWSMTYRMDSDIPVPYGRTVQLSSTLTDESFIYEKLQKKNKLLAIMGSNCGGRNNRWNYVRKLKKILGNNFDIIGKCSNGNKTLCPGHFRKDCQILENYKFYLAFENTNCRQYLTEKLFWNAYEKFAIPVIMGAPQEDCDQLLPPNSFLHVNNFSSQLSLANYLKYLSENNKFIQFHTWRMQYRIINEHGYFGSSTKHYCRACEALHYNSIDKKIYHNLETFWNKSKDCILPKN